MVRVLVAPRVLNDANEAGLLKELNRLNKGFKSFKYYLTITAHLFWTAAFCCPAAKRTAI